MFVVALCCLFFGVGVSVVFRLTFVRAVYGSVWLGCLVVAFRGDGCSLCWPSVLFMFWPFVILVVSRFCFGGLGLGSGCSSS